MAATWLRICALATAGLVAGTAAPSAPALEIAIDAPAGVEVETGPGGIAFLAGRVPYFANGAGGLDLVLAIDVSDSTDEPSPSTPAAVRLEARPSWRRRLRESVLGPRRPHRDETLLAHEIRLAQELLRGLDPRTTRVGVVAFAGDLDPSTPDAWTVTPLSAERRRAEAGLSRLLERGPGGFTNRGAGVARAVAELLATPSAASATRGRVRRAALVLTDGVGPSRFETASPGWARRRDARVARAGRAQVRVDVVIVGEEARRPNTPAGAWVRGSGAELVRVPDARPSPLAGELAYSGTRSLAVRNLTSGASASSLETTPDGGFGCLVALVPGLNRVEVRAELAGGGALVRIVELRKGVPDPPVALAPRLLAQRNRLLREHLRGLVAGRPRRAGPRARHLELALDPPPPASPALEDE